MRYQWCMFRTALLTQLRSPRTWLLLLLPVVLWTLSAALPPETASAAVQVGVCLPETGGEAFWQLLESREDGVLDFIEADEAQIEEKVATGQWDCGLTVPPDLEARLADLDTDALLVLWISEASTVYPLVRETASACVAELLAPAMAADYLNGSGIPWDGSGPATLSAAERVCLTLSTLDGTHLDAPALTTRTLENVLRGLLAAVLLIWAMLCAVDLGGWMETGAVRRFRALQPVTVLVLPRITAVALPAAAATLLAVLALPGGWQELGAAAAYVAALWGLALLTARWKPLWSVFPVWLPLTPVLCFLLTPVLLDPGSLIPALGAVSRWLPVTWYLEGRVLPLLVMALICPAVSLCLDLLPARH